MSQLIDCRHPLTKTLRRSAVSWGLDVAGKRGVRIINVWPDPRSTTTFSVSNTVPTQLAFDLRDNKVGFHWGFAVESPMISDLRWFSFLDSIKQTHTSARRSPMRPSEKSTEVAACLAYLQSLWNYAKKDICDRLGDMWDSLYNPMVVLTVTDDYSPSMMKEILDIASKACFPARLKLVPEYEAATLAALVDLRDDHGPTEAGDCFVLCNAALYNVDVISCKINSLLPFAMEECTLRTCKRFF